jgi:hypothetical protein
VVDRSVALEEKIETVRLMAQRFTGGPKVAAEVFELIDPELEVNGLPGAPDNEWHYGHEGLVEFAVAIWEAFEQLEITTSEFIEAPDGRLLFKFVGSAVGKLSGAPAPVRGYGVYTFRERRVVRAEHLASRSEAFAVAGIKA